MRAAHKSREQKQSVQPAVVLRPGCSSRVIPARCICMRYLPSLPLTPAAAHVNVQNHSEATTLSGRPVRCVLHLLQGK